MSVSMEPRKKSQRGQQSKAPIRVLVVDDSLTVRRYIRQVLQATPEIQVVGEAADGKEAIARCLELKPDVITLDIAMPVMDGLEATERIMSCRPTPIVIVSGAENRGELFPSFEALKAGAVEVVEKPGSGERFAADPKIWEQHLRFLVRVASGVAVVTRISSHQHLCENPAHPGSSEPFRGAELPPEKKGIFSPLKKREKQSAASTPPIAVSAGDQEGAGPFKQPHPHSQQSARAWMVSKESQEHSSLGSTPGETQGAPGSARSHRSQEYDVPGDGNKKEARTFEELASDTYFNSPPPPSKASPNGPSATNSHQLSRPPNEFVHSPKTSDHLHHLVALAASTGGPRLLGDILRALPSSFPLPILIVIHLNQSFAAAFASWLQTQTSLPLSLAEHGRPLPPPGKGAVFLAPPDHHLCLEEGRFVLGQGALRHSLRPSADVLFESLATEAAHGTLAGVLTGMGSDGAAGLLALRRAGARTFAQDEKTSAVFGMPARAISLGAAQRILPATHIAPAIRAFASQASRLQISP